MNIAVFVSGRGSNLRAIVNSGILAGKVFVKVVVSDKISCPAFEFASSKKIDTLTVSGKKSPDTVTYDELAAILNENGIHLVVLAGFLKLIPAEFIRKLNCKIINIHPALLPSYGGKGMYGMNVHNAVFSSGDKMSGATVHYVNERYDEGAIIANLPVDISNAKSPDEIASLVLEKEHILLPKVIYDFYLNWIDGN